MKRTVILLLAGMLFCIVVVGYKCWKYPSYDAAHASCYEGRFIKIDWEYNYFRAAPKYYGLLETDGSVLFYIHPLLVGSIDVTTLENSVYKPVTVLYDAAADKKAYGAYRVLAISEDSNEILSLEKTNRVFKEQRLIGIFTGVVVLIPIGVIAFWLMEDKQKKKKKPN